jgi:hypothetical protein
VASGVTSSAPSVGTPESMGIGFTSSGGGMCCYGGGASTCTSCSILRGEVRASGHEVAVERRGCTGLPTSRVLWLRWVWMGFWGNGVGSGY